MPAELWDQDPAPDAGCPLLGGPWRIVVDWLAVWSEPPRQYGTGTYGSGQYGFGSDATGDAWQDITPAVAGCRIVRGNPGSESWQVQVSSCQLDLVDDDASVVRIPDHADPPVRITLGCRVRVGVIDPAGDYHPLFTGRVETVSDDHDAPPRVVQVEAFGTALDLVYPAPAAARPAEPVTERVPDLLAASGWWDWAPADVSAVDPVQLTAWTPADAETVRAAIDLAAVSAGASADDTPRGAVRLLPWPLQPATSPVAAFTDCDDGTEPAALPTQSQVWRADMAELVNLAAVTNTTGDSDTASDTASVSRYGPRANGLGLPLPDLTRSAAGLPVVADAIVDRYGKNTQRCLSATLVADDDERRAYAATADRGQFVLVDRRQVAPVAMPAVVSGVEHFLSPDTWELVVHLTVLPGTYGYRTIDTDSRRTIDTGAPRTYYAQGD